MTTKEIVISLIILLTTIGVMFASLVKRQIVIRAQIKLIAYYAYKFNFIQVLTEVLLASAMSPKDGVFDNRTIRYLQSIKDASNHGFIALTNYLNSVPGGTDAVEEITNEHKQ